MSACNSSRLKNLIVRFNKLLLSTLFASLFSQAVIAGDLTTKNENRESASETISFTDQQDGQLDVSDWLQSQYGFLITPILITGPTLGYGLGLNALFLHDQFGSEKKEGERNSPPSLSGIALAGTENGTKIAAGYHAAFLKNDTLRSTSFIGIPDINMNFYPQIVGREFKIKMNLSGVLAYQELKFRIQESNFFLGGNLLYSKVESQIETGLPPAIDELLKQTTQTVALAAVAEYDTRNTIFTPDSGTYAKFVASKYSESLGSDFDAWNLRAKAFSFQPLHERFVLGLRGEFEAIEGDAPYYMYPSVNIRGIAIGRYQGQYTGVFESEGRLAIDQRWSLIGFIGSGKAFGDNRLTGSSNNFSDADWRTAGGIGFRYQLARKFKLHIGMDFAIGPEESSIYITTGQAWNAYF